MIGPLTSHARKLMARGRRAVREGMPPPQDEEAWVGVGLLMLDRLASSDRRSGAAEAAEIALDAVESTLARRPAGPPVACKRGCSYCCTTVVGASAPEVFRLARWIRHNGNAMPQIAPAAVIARCDARSGLTFAQLETQRRPCPLLIEGACGVYAARPVNCRRLLSTSLEACRADYEGRTTTIPYVEETMQKGTHIRALLLAAVQAARLPTSSYELAQALSIALQRPEAEQEWLAGVDVFGGVAITHGLDNLQAAADRWSSRILAAARRP